MVNQDLINNLYNLDNLLEIQIDIPDDQWEELRNAEPAGGWGHQGQRYEWYQADSVTLTTRDFQERKFQNVGMIKKSFMGSKDNVKPSFRLDFTRFQESNESEIEGLIGTKTLVLNNCKQDNTYIRQPLGYRLLREAGVPSLRCNLATVNINGEDMGVYVNIEAFRKPFLANAFNGNIKGNAYEIELQQDLLTDSWNAWHKGPSFEGYSKFENSKDIKLVAEKLDDYDWEAVQKVFDIDAFIRFFAMETLLKHWDGFTQTINNTFVYNDVVAVANPSVDNIKFKFIPSGIDQILSQDRTVKYGRVARIAEMIIEDKSARQKLDDQVQEYVTGKVFDEKFTGEQIRRLKTVLLRANIASGDAENFGNNLAEQLRQVKEDASGEISVGDTREF